MNKYNFTGHGRVVCKKCEKVLTSCKCIKCADNVKEVMCEECEGEVVCSGAEEPKGGGAISTS